MRRIVTLGADENGQVYGLDLEEDGTWRRNPIGLSTNCIVIRPMSRDAYEYMTEDAESVKELWRMSVADDRTCLGLDDWFDTLSKDDLIDDSGVYDLLDDTENPTVGTFARLAAAGERRPASFREFVEKVLVDSDAVMSVLDADDVFEWEAAGCFPPCRPFAVEFAPHELCEEYYAHLRKTEKEFRG